MKVKMGINVVPIFVAPNECPFIKNNVKQGFAEHFQNLNSEPIRIGNHGPIDLYHERVKILDRFK
jgi:hypothetical protein